MTLATFVTMDKDDRYSLIQRAVYENVAPDDDLQTFITCVGDFAATKSQELELLQIIGWCENERTTLPERFTAHFNELDAPDLSSTATVMCRNVVRSKLASPSSADFPWVPDTSISRGRHTYLIRSSFDAQNAYGASIRAQYHCEIQYDGKGDVYDLASWSIKEFEIL